MIPGETATPSGLINIMIVDDHPAVREGLALRISQYPDLRLCCEAASVSEALALLCDHHPDVVIVDISLKDGNGIELIKRIQSRDKSIRILVCSMHDESIYAERAIRAGAMGYITKEHATSQIIEAIRRIVDNQLYVSERVADRLVQRTLGKSSKLAASSSVQLLSDRELEVFQFLGQALDTNQIAERMHVSPKTVETYRARIKEKLGIHTIPELFRRAVEFCLEES